jgi:hypothetical protein
MPGGLGFGLWFGSSAGVRWCLEGALQLARHPPPMQAWDQRMPMPPPVARPKSLGELRCIPPAPAGEEPPHMQLLANREGLGGHPLGHEPEISCCPPHTEAMADPAVIPPEEGACEEHTEARVLPDALEPHQEGMGQVPFRMEQNGREVALRPGCLFVSAGQQQA